MIARAFSIAIADVYLHIAHSDEVMLFNRVRHKLCALYVKSIPKKTKERKEASRFLALTPSSDAAHLSSVHPLLSAWETSGTPTRSRPCGCERHSHQPQLWQRSKTQNSRRLNQEPTGTRARVCVWGGGDRVLCSVRIHHAV